MADLFCARKVCGHGPLRPQHRPGIPRKDQHAGRGLCGGCYDHLTRHDPDALLDYPSLTRPTLETADEAELLRARTGKKWRDIAADLGLTESGLASVRTRARRIREDAA